MTSENDLVGKLASADTDSAATGQDDGSGVFRNADELDQLCDEADALSLYIARQGDCLGEADWPLYERLLKTVSAAKSSPSLENRESLMEAYAAVTAITYRNRHVNGRTILDTQEKVPKNTSRWALPRARPVLLGIVLFILVMLFELWKDWAKSISDPGSLPVFYAYLYHFVRTFYAFLIPAAWGGLGACVFLAKRISDKLLVMAYDKARAYGDLTRIFLGAMLGVIVVVIFFPDFDSQLRRGDGWAPEMAAFIAGLGVKPVYAAFELLSEELARRFGGNREEFRN